MRDDLIQRREQPPIPLSSHAPILTIDAFVPDTSWAAQFAVVCTPGSSYVEHSGASQQSLNSPPIDPKSWLQKVRDFAHFLYDGNLKTFKSAMQASAYVSWPVALLAAGVVHFAGAANLVTSIVSTAASYVWYPAFAYFNYRNQDKDLLTANRQAGTSHSGARLSGSYLLQTVMCDGLWLGAMLGGQFALRSVAHAHPLFASTVTHVACSIIIGIGLNQPIRKIANWSCGLEPPRHRS
jgi:hypothetical protein